MRKIFLILLILTSLIIACETKTPVGPGTLTVVQTTSSTTTITTTTVGPSTTSTTTTTTTVTGSASRRYMSFQPPPDIPADMTLFFELLLAPAPASSPGPSVAGQANVEAENEYKVTGVYIMGNGTSGAINGELGGSSNPLETGGTFEGTMTAKTTSGCAAERKYSGQLTAQTLQWAAGAMVSNTCSSSNPLGFLTLTMFRGDGAAPLPTTTIGPSTTTTSSVVCTYSLSSQTAQVSSSGGTVSVAIATPAGCPWSAQSFADWITVRPPFGGSGPATVTFDVQPSTAARTGNLLIAGTQFVVSQSAPVTTTTSTTSSSSSTTTTSILPADLVPYVPTGGADFCRTDASGNLLVGVLNQGAGTAPASVTRVEFRFGTTVTSDMSTPSLAPKGTTDVTFPIPSGCYDPDCDFNITVNADGAVTESSTTNNVASGTCIG